MGEAGADGIGSLELGQEVGKGDCKDSIRSFMNENATKRSGEAEGSNKKRC